MVHLKINKQIKDCNVMNLTNECTVFLEGCVASTPAWAHSTSSIKILKLILKASPSKD